MMRQEVLDLINLGPLPSEEDATEEVIGRYEETISKIGKPVSDDEAIALVDMFGPDDCYGLAWSLVHLIESAPGWPIRSALEGKNNYWIAHLKQTIANTYGWKW